MIKKANHSHQRQTEYQQLLTGTLLDKANHDIDHFMATQEGLTLTE